MWKKFTIQQCAPRFHTANSVTNYLNKNVPNYIRKENWSPNSCDLNLLDYAIWDIVKKKLYKNLKRYKYIEGLSAAMSYAWNRLTKKFMYNSINQLQMRLEKNGRRRRWPHCTSILTTPTHDLTQISIVIDMLFINRKLNMIKWL